MNKAKILLTLCCALASSQITANELNLYGVGHISFDSNDDGADSQFYIASNSSRFGLDGNYRIGNSGEVFFQFESGIDLTGRGENDGNGGGQSNSLFTKARDSFVGYKSDWASVKVGRLGVLNQWLYDVNLFADQVGDLGNIWGATGIPGRANSAAMIEFNGSKNFAAIVQYVPENGTENSDIILGKLSFAMENFNIHFSAANVAQGVINNEHDVWAITGRYTLHQTQIGFGYQSESDIAGIGDNDRDTFTLGLNHPLGDGNFKLQYTSSDSDYDFFSGSQITVGYDYSLNDSITSYVAVNSTSNDELSTFTANNYGHGQSVSPLIGNDPLSVSIGIIYKFRANIYK